MELFTVTKKSSKAALFTTNSKVEAKAYRDSANQNAGWVKNEAKDPDNCESMPYVVRKGKDHWKS